MSTQTIQITQEQDTPKSLFWTPEEKEPIIKSIREQNIFGAVDSSGSTAGAILRDEKRTTECMGLDRPNQKMVLWSNRYNGYRSTLDTFQSLEWKSDGGTDPETVFHRRSDPPFEKWSISVLFEY